MKFGKKSQKQSKKEYKQISKDENSKSKLNKVSNGKIKKPKNIDEKDAQENKISSRQNKRLKKALKKKTLFDKLSESKNVTDPITQKVTQEKIEKIQKQFAHFKSLPSLTKTQKRKIRDLKKALKLAGVEPDTVTANTDINIKKENIEIGNITSKKNKKVKTESEMEISNENKESVNKMDDTNNISKKKNKKNKKNGTEKTLEIKEEIKMEVDDEDDNVDKSEKVVQNKRLKMFAGVNALNIKNEKDNKSKYVVFVGNLPFDATKEQISEHFSKVGNVCDVRIPLGENKKKRGFAYVEFDNNETYEKALSLQNTFIGGRRINVQYTLAGSKNSKARKDVIKTKNLKLNELRKQGKLTGSKIEKNKRSFRRKKINNDNKQSD